MAVRYAGMRKKRTGGNPPPSPTPTPTPGASQGLSQAYGQSLSGAPLRKAAEDVSRWLAAQAQRMMSGGLQFPQLPRIRFGGSVEAAATRSAPASTMASRVATYKANYRLRYGKPYVPGPTGRTDLRGGR